MMFTFARAVLSVLFGSGVLFAVLAPEKTESAKKSLIAVSSLTLMSTQLVNTTSGMEPDECQKWAAKGQRAKQGCEKCAAGYPFRTDQCMFCGGICKKKTCADKRGEDCFGSPAFHECHGACMAKVADKVQTQKAAAEMKKAVLAKVAEKSLELSSAPGDCAKYEARGPLAVRGCAKCAAYHPGKTDECMICGGSCRREVCERSDFGECVKTLAFRECHKACMAKDSASSAVLREHDPEHDNDDEHGHNHHVHEQHHHNHDRDYDDVHHDHEHHDHEHHDHEHHDHEHHEHHDHHSE